MKQCPKCQRAYLDLTLNFCLEDGTPLQDYVQASDFPTEVMPHSMDLPTRMFSSGDRGASSPFVPPDSIARPANSIAVLPFAHMSRDPDDEYFCDGLAEELINALSRVDDLKVVARSSAFSFRGKNVDVATVGATLGVNNVVEGSVRKFGDRLRINVSLTSTADGFNLWSDKYDTEMRDIFDVQDEITRSVVRSLKEKLLGRTENEDEKMAALIEELKHHAHDVHAYQLYLRGRYLFNKFTEPDLYRALECFHGAIEADPNFAEAYAGIADVYIWLTELGPLMPRDGMPKAKDAALKAIELNTDLSEAHTSLAIVLQEFDYEFEKAEGSYKRAIELNANNALAHQMYGALLAQLGRFGESERRFERALTLDPLSPTGTWIYPFGLFLARRYDRSIERARKILELDDNFAAANLILSFNFQMKGDFEACKENYCRFLEIFGLNDVASSARSGFEAGGWDGFLRAMTRPDVRKGVTAYISAVYFAALGEDNVALDCLEESYRLREGHVVMLNVDPRFDRIREHPRFQELLKTVGFQDHNSDL